MAKKALKKTLKHVKWVDGYNSHQKLLLFGDTGSDSDEQNPDLDIPATSSCLRITPEDFNSKIYTEKAIAKLVKSSEYKL